MGEMAVLIFCEDQQCYCFFVVFFIKSRFNTVFLFFCEGQNNGITIFYDPSAIYSLNVQFIWTIPVSSP